MDDGGKVIIYITQINISQGRRIGFHGTCSIEVRVQARALPEKRGLTAAQVVLKRSEVLYWSRADSDVQLLMVQILTIPSCSLRNTSRAMQPSRPRMAVLAFSKMSKNKGSFPGNSGIMTIRLIIRKCVCYEHRPNILQKFVNLTAGMATVST